MLNNTTILKTHKVVACRTNSLLTAAIAIRKVNKSSNDMKTPFQYTQGGDV